MHRAVFGVVATGAVAFVSLVAMAMLRPGGPRPPMPDSPIAAAQFRYEQRLSENGRIPDNALMNAVAQRDSLLAAQVQLGDTGNYPGGWTWLGPGNIGGRIRAILVNPSDPNIIYIGAASGGVWKTTNGGAHWEPLDDFMPSLAIGCMAMDPTNPSVLYAGTGEGFFETVEGSSNTAAVRGAGIFKSTDAGANWHQIPSTANPDWYFVNRLAISPSNPLHILAATQTGIYRSLDGGTSWAKVFSGIVYDVRFHPSDGTKAVAGMHDVGAAYSNDGGATWTAAAGIDGHRVELCYAPGNPTWVYALRSANGVITIYRSTDGGQNYTLRNTGSGIQTYEAYNSTLWVDPANSDRLILGGVYLYRSTNGGQTQTRTYNSVHADMHAVVTHPGYNGTTNRIVYFGTDGGIYRADDSTGSTAVALNNNLGITQWYGATMNPISGRVIAGAQDNGTKLFSGNPQAWTTVAGGDGGFTATDHTDANFMYGEIQWAYVFRSMNGGSSAAYIWNHTNPIVGAGTTQFNFIPYLILDPNDPNRMYVGGRLLWRSNNVKAATVDWSSVKDTIQPGGAPIKLNPPGSHMAGNSPWNISAIAIAPGNSNLVYVGYNNGQIWKSTNALAATPSWIRLDDATGPMPERWVSKIIVDPLDNSRAYATFMGWEADNVWRTTDGGTNWTNISGVAPFNLPSMPVGCIAKHPTQPGWLFVGTELGIFSSVDDGQSWTATNTGPSMVPVEELHWIGTSRLIAVTHGRGVYQTDLNAPDIPFSPDAYVPNSAVWVSGRLQEMYGSDDRRLVHDSPGARGRITVSGTSPVAVPTYFRLKVEVSGSSSTIPLTVLLRNHRTGNFERVAMKKLLTDDRVHEVVMANPADYVNATTRKAEAILLWEQRAGSPTARFSVDQVLFTVRQ